jgi:hypothetical protein
MRFLGSIRWIALALAGLVVAATVSLAASQLVSERIGLAAEPVSAGRDLAPQATRSDAPHAGHRGDRPSSPPTRATTTTAPRVTTTAVPRTTTTTPPPAPATVAPTTTAPAPSPPSSGSGGEHEGADD